MKFLYSFILLLTDSKQFFFDYSKTALKMIYSIYYLFFDKNI